MENLKLTAVFVEGEHRYTAYIEEMRGVITEGDTIEEAEDNLMDALQVYLSPDEKLSEEDKMTYKVHKKPFLSISKIS